MFNGSSNLFPEPGPWFPDARIPENLSSEFSAVLPATPECNRYFAVDPPATTFVEVSSLVNKGWMVEIEVQAVVQQ